jgi:hypothetical protein
VAVRRPVASAGAHVTPSEERATRQDELLDYAQAQFPLPPRSDKIRAVLQGRTRREDERGDLVHGAAALVEAARLLRDEERIDREALSRLAVRDAQRQRQIGILGALCVLLAVAAVGPWVPWALGLLWWLGGALWG